MDKYEKTLLANIEAYGCSVTSVFDPEGEDPHVEFGPVAGMHRKGYMRSACWLHGGAGFEALQLLWPNTSGIWPWDKEASDWLRCRQPLLSGSGGHDA